MHTYLHTHIRTCIQTYSTIHTLLSIAPFHISPATPACPPACVTPQYHVIRCSILQYDTTQSSTAPYVLYSASQYNTTRIHTHVCIYIYTHTYIHTYMLIYSRPETGRRLQTAFGGMSGNSLSVGPQDSTADFVRSVEIMHHQTESTSSQKLRGTAPRHPEDCSHDFLETGNAQKPETTAPSQIQCGVDNDRIPLQVPSQDNVEGCAPHAQLRACSFRFLVTPSDSAQSMRAARGKI